MLKSRQYQLKQSRKTPMMLLLSPIELQHSSSSQVMLSYQGKMTLIGHLCCQKYLSASYHLQSLNQLYSKVNSHKLNKKSPLQILMNLTSRGVHRNKVTCRLDWQSALSLQRRKTVTLYSTLHRHQSKRRGIIGKLIHQINSGHQSPLRKQCKVSNT